MAAIKTTESGENPLVPNAKLRAMYTTMLEARVLEDSAHARARSKHTKPATIRGQEALRAAAAHQFNAHDLISDSTPTLGMASILGANPIALLKTISSRNKSSTPTADRLLPTMDDTVERTRMALGAALALKAQRKHGVVFAFLAKKELAQLSSSAFARLLKSSAAHELPIIFVILPRPIARRKGDELATVARTASRSGVPGIPVDASDAVALYRVLQESLGRTRAGDGPVLIECVTWPTRTHPAPTDPIDHLKQFLLTKKIASPAWFRQTEISARKRLKTSRRRSSLS